MYNLVFVRSILLIFGIFRKCACETSGNVKCSEISMRIISWWSKMQFCIYHCIQTVHERFDCLIVLMRALEPRKRTHCERSQGAGQIGGVRAAGQIGFKSSYCNLICCRIYELLTEQTSAFQINCSELDKDNPKPEKC